MLGVNEVYNWQCLKSIRVMYLNISCSEAELLIICPHPVEEASLSANEERFPPCYGGQAFQVNT